MNMAYSKCPKCENKQFEVKLNSPANSNYQLLFVQCSSCGTVIGTMDYSNIGARLNEIEKKIDNLNSSNINSKPNDYNFTIINENIARLFNYLRSKLDKD